MKILLVATRICVTSEFDIHEVGFILAFDGNLLCKLVFDLGGNVDAKSSLIFGHQFHYFHSNLSRTLMGEFVIIGSVVPPHYNEVFSYFILMNSGSWIFAVELQSNLSFTQNTQIIYI